MELYIRLFGEPNAIAAFSRNANAFIYAPLIRQYFEKNAELWRKNSRAPSFAQLQWWKWYLNFELVKQNQPLNNSATLFKHLSWKLVCVCRILRIKATNPLALFEENSTKKKPIFRCCCLQVVGKNAKMPFAYNLWHWWKFKLTHSMQRKRKIQQRD